jgi:hypothetical protein
MAKRDFGPLTKGITATQPFLIVAALLLGSFVVGKREFLHTF